jgi:hypothetical protein
MISRNNLDAVVNARCEARRKIVIYITKGETVNFDTYEDDMAVSVLVNFV